MDGELPNPPVHYNMGNYAFEESHFRWAKDGTFTFLVEGGAINPNDTQDPGVTAIVKAQISDEIMTLADGTSSPIVKILEIKHIRSVELPSS